MTPQQIAEIRERANAATEGPWRADTATSGPDDWPIMAASTGYLSICPDCGTRGGMDRPDAEFVAHAREDVPALLAEVDRLHVERITSVIMSHHRDAPRPFVLYRRTDATGVSGTGVVAEGCAFNDGSAVLRWLSDWPTSVVFHDRGIEAIETVHGHNGATQVVWVSEELEPLADMEQQRDEARAEVERLHSWDGLMSLLDEHWPEDLCPTVEDDDQRDSGARIVSLIRWVERLRGQLAQARAIHTSWTYRGEQFCESCSGSDTDPYGGYVPWPCPTIRALDVESGGIRDAE